jgi:cellulose synthase/poly-beta-1,6-N-acetylglucosamine synthase-like glycosyltransferase
VIAAAFISSLGLANLVLAWALALIWAVHLIEAARGMPKIEEITRKEWNVPPEWIISCETNRSTPPVTIVVPARNEAKTIEPALRSLRDLDYPRYDLVVVDDRSDDGTGDIIRRIVAEDGGAPVRIISVRELPVGWLGKTHAMWVGARETKNDWILFTDADVVFRPDSVRRAIAYAEKQEVDHLVLFPTMLTYTPGERMMTALFQALIGFGHRPWKVPDPDARDYIGVGAFNMIRRSVYEKIGAYERLRMSIMDDMDLGRLVKKCHYHQRCAFGHNLARIHWAQGPMGIVDNVTKNFFAYMRFKSWLAFAIACALLLTNVWPFIAVFFSSDWATVGYVVAIVCVLAIYAGMAPKSGIGPWYFFTHPISASLFAYAVVLSAVTTLRRGGVEWRGTFYPLEQLKQFTE